MFQSRLKYWLICHPYVLDAGIQESNNASPFVVCKFGEKSKYWQRLDAQKHLTLWSRVEMKKGVATKDRNL